MVRNNRRKAFTIVEIVIVIAVIAILAAVMIPTFSGIIKRANISADVQLSASMNTQLSIYKAEGNKIETEADLINALKSDFDFIANLNPKSAKHGYHYWYNAVENKVEVLTYEQAGDRSEEIKATLSTKHPTADNKEDEAAFNFAHASPRTVVPGFYLLDQKNGEGENVIAEFFNTVASMSGADADYNAAIADLKEVGGDNETLAKAILAKMEATAIVTDKGAYIYVNEGSEIKVSHIYIPANNTENKDNYYLNHTIINVGDADVNNLLDVSNASNSTIELPADVKAAEGSLNGFANVTIKVDTDNPADLNTIFSAESVSSSATIVLNDGSTYKIEGTVVKDNKDAEVATLTYRNPVKEFTISASGNVVNYYIALDKIKNSNSPIQLSLSAEGFKGTVEGLPIYDDVKWTTKTEGVSVDDNGRVTFNGNFNANTITFTATAVAGGKAVDYPVTVVTLDKITTKLNNVDVTFAKVNDSEWTLTSAQSLVLGVATGADNTTIKANANLSGEYTYYYSGIDFTNQLDKLGVAPVITFTTGDNYFKINNLACAFSLDKVRALDGGVGEENVTIKVEESYATHSATVNVKVKDNTNVPYAVTIPSYKATEPLDVDVDGEMDSIIYRYRVGNATPLPIGELFTLKEGKTAGDYSVFIFNSEPAGDGYFSNTNLVEEFNLGQVTSLNFSGSKYTASNDQTYYLVLGVKELDQYGNLKVYAPEAANIVEITIVNKGVNVTQKSEFTTPSAGQSIVLHNDLEGFAAQGGEYLTLNGGGIYGNYFTVDASEYYDTNAMEDNKHSFIVMTNGSINQFILDGPVFPKQVIMSKDVLADPTTFLGNGSTYFCHGIEIHGTKVTINDSYLSHFNSPVFLYCETIEANNTVFEGGSLANVYIRSGVKNVNFTNVMTVQNREGYSTTIPGKSGSVLGMGIFIHKDQTTSLNFNFVNVEQYNWLGSTDKIGTYTKQAIEAVYGSYGKWYSKQTSVALISQYSVYGHSSGEKVTEDGKEVEKQYVNAAIAAVNKAETTVVTIISKDENGNIKYTYKGGDGSASSGEQSGTVWISTYAHNDVCPCMDGNNQNEGINFTYGGADAFKATAVE